jgi:hypothetical protein
MNKNSITLGYWSSLLSAALFIAFTLCFIAIAISNPVFRWTNVNDYSMRVHVYNQLFKNIAQASMLLFAPVFVVLMSSVHDLASDEKRIYSRIALAFAIIFATLVGLHYFVQLAAVRINVENNHLEGLEQFIQSNPNSYIASVNMLGWSLFFGLSSLFIVPVFIRGRLEKAIKWLFLLNGIFCLAGGVGFVFENVLIVFLTLNFGMGGCVMAVSILLSIYFWKQRDILT